MKYETDAERLEARRATARRYSRSSKGLANEARRDKTKAREAYARYRQTPGYAEAQERRRVKDQAAGWPIQSAKNERLRTEQPERFAAYMAVQLAVRSGVLVRPDACSQCEAERRLHAHHPNGYAPEHRLDVVWLCSPCHRVTHR